MYETRGEGARKKTYRGRVQKLNYGEEGGLDLQHSDPLTILNGKALIKIVKTMTNQIE